MRKEPRKAVHLCPWMDGNAQGAKDGGYVHGWAVCHKEPGMAVMSMEGRYATKSQGWRLCPWKDGIPQRARDGGVACCGVFLQINNLVVLNGNL